MEGKGNFIVLLIIVAFLSLTLAALAGYVFFVGGSPHSAEATPKTNITTRPSDDDLSERVLLEKKYFNLKPSEDKKVSVIEVTAKMQYLKEVKGIKDIEKKMTAYESEIKEIVGTYFLKMTINEAQLPETKEKAKKELTKKINELLMASEKEKNPIVYTINFEEWLFQ